MSQMVQNEGTHILQRQNHEHAHSSRSVQGPVQGGVTQGSIRGKAHRLPDNAHSNGQHFSGAMERYIWVRFAGKLTTCQTPHIAPVSISVGRWMKCLGRFKMQTLTYCGAKITSTRTAVGQFKGQFNGRWNVTHGWGDGTLHMGSI